MEDMIKKLVEVDRDCTKRVEAAKQKKIDVQKNVSQQRQQIYDAFIKEQQQKIEEHKNKLREANLAEENQLKEEYAAKMQQLEKIYLEKKDTWVLEIVERCLQ